jgi:hypothetical protein
LGMAGRRHGNDGEQSNDFSAQKHKLGN